MFYRHGFKQRQLTTSDMIRWLIRRFRHIVREMIDIEAEYNDGVVSVTILFEDTPLLHRTFKTGI